MKASFRNFDKNYVCTRVPPNQRFRYHCNYTLKTTLSFLAFLLRVWIVPHCPLIYICPIYHDHHFFCWEWGHSDIVFRSSAVGDITRDKYGYTSCPSLLTFYHLSFTGKVSNVHVFALQHKGVLVHHQRLIFRKSTVKPHPLKLSNTAITIMHDNLSYSKRSTWNYFELHKYILHTTLRWNLDYYYPHN
mgnify:CR=1 FL=1